MRLTPEQYEDICRARGLNPATGEPAAADTKGQLQPDNPPQGSQPEHALRFESLGAPTRKKSNASRIHVRLESVRHRLIDPDNLCFKYFIDCLRYCGAIPDDSAYHINLSVSQRKVPKTERETTEITVEYVSP